MPCCGTRPVRVGVLPVVHLRPAAVLEHPVQHRRGDKLPRPVTNTAGTVRRETGGDYSGVPGAEDARNRFPGRMPVAAATPVRIVGWRFSMLGRPRLQRVDARLARPERRAAHDNARYRVRADTTARTSEATKPARSITGAPRPSRHATPGQRPTSPRPQTAGSPRSTPPSTQSNP